MTAKRKRDNKKKRANTRIEYIAKHTNFKYEDCAICGESPTVAHHENYDLWNSIIFLCEKHHRTTHKNGFVKIPTKKYTIEISKEDVDNFHNVVGLLEFYLHKTYNTDSKIYRDLPCLTVKLEGKLQDLRKANDELTAKLEQLEDLRTSFCRIFELCDISTGIIHSQHEIMRMVLDVIKVLCDESEDGNASRSEIVYGAGVRGIESSRAESALDRLKRNGQIYESIHGKYRVVDG